MNIFEEQRKYYPILQKTVYLDSPSSGLIPSYAANASCAYIKDRCENGMSVDKYYENWDTIDALRGEIAKMLSCSSDEIAFGESASSLFNIFSNGIHLEKGDNVVLYSTVWPALTYSWINKKDLGIEMRCFHPKDGTVNPEDLLALADEHTRAVCVCHVDNHTGFRHNLSRLGELCHKRGIYLAVDATQSCGVVNINAKDMNVDFLVASGYKWLQGILGIGFAYINIDLLKTLSQSNIGWAGTENKKSNDALVLKLSKNANRYEYGGQNIVAAVGLLRTVQNYNKLGAINIENYVLELVNYIYEKARNIPEISIYGDYSSENRSNIVCINFPLAWSHITKAYLEENNVSALLLNRNCIRIGVHYFNNNNDIDCLFKLLHE